MKLTHAGCGQGRGCSIRFFTPKQQSQDHTTMEAAATMTLKENARRNIILWQSGVPYTLSSTFISFYMQDSSKTAMASRMTPNSPISSL